MNMITGLLAVMLTVAAYLAARMIHEKMTYPFTIPIILSTTFIILFLVVFDLSYGSYMIGGDWINELLGPAVVALAYPLYLQRSTLLKLAGPLLIGTVTGAFTGVASGLLLAKWAGFEEVILFSITTKSVTTPVAMAVTGSLGGITSLAAVFVMIAGIGGVLIHTYVFQLFRLKSDVGQGIGLGSASHAIGTAGAIEQSQLKGSISTIAMVVSAVVVSLITPLLISWLM